MSDSKKKKKSIGVELTLGSGLLLIFFPCIIVGIIGATWGVVDGIAGRNYMLGGMEISGLPLLFIFGLLLLVTLFITYKFSTRFAMLVRRLFGLIQERRRIRLQTRTIETSVSTASDDFVTEQKASER